MPEMKHSRPILPVLALGLLLAVMPGCTTDRSLSRQPDIDTTPVPAQGGGPASAVHSRDLPPSGVPTTVYTSESDTPLRSSVAPRPAAEPEPVYEDPTDPYLDSEPAPSSAPAKAQAPAPADDSWVAGLKIAESATQIVAVAVEPGTSNATVSMWDKLPDGTWSEIFTAPGFIGKGGLGKTADGDRKTPQGQYHFTRAFGTADAPAMRHSSYTYHKLTDSDYWVGDSKSSFYNKLADASTTRGFDTSKGARLIRQPAANKYALAISYNAQGEPGKGSGIFLHCSTGGPTMGSVAIPEEAMLQVLTHVTTTTVILIDRSTRLASY